MCDMTKLVRHDTQLRLCSLDFLSHFVREPECGGDSAWTVSIVPRHAGNYYLHHPALHTRFGGAF